MTTPLRASTNLDLQYQGLESESYTATRLKHASPEHLHYTTRRCFIGPIPEGWLKAHRKSWYKEKLGFGGYSSRRATFTASTTISHQKQLTGLDGPSAGAMFGHSFPQPADTIEEDDDGGGTSQEQTDVEDTTEIEPVSIMEAAVEENVHQTGAMPPIEAVDGAGDEGRASRSADHNRLAIPQNTNRNRKSASSTREAKSFVTAHERQHSPSATSPLRLPGNVEEEPDQAGPSILVQEGTDQPPESRPVVSGGRGQSPSRSSLPIEETTPADTHSAASLIPRRDKSDARSQMSRPMARSLTEQAPEEHAGSARDTYQRKKRGLTFNISDNVINQQDKMQARLKRVKSRTESNRFRRKKLRDGEIVKMERMLVRVDSTLQTLPPDYDENDSLKTESRIEEKWREFVVVCRQTEDQDADFTLQMYKTRVIPEVEKKEVKKRSTHDIPLNRKTTRVNLYSSLDKTVVIWHPYRKKIMIYIIRPRSSANSVEWYTFIRDALGWNRPSTLQINVPDLSVSLRIDKPFEKLEASREEIQATDGNDAALLRTMVEERAAAHRLIRKSMEMLENSPEWANILDTWSKTEKMGLAWKRYDRLEWVHGVNEQKMYGTMAMLKSHDLELRPKQHYPTKIQVPGGETIREPPPVEGFLIRLTSQKGAHQRFGKMFFKRLYFSTHNQYICFCRPAKATPPAPPTLPLKSGSHIPTATEIVKHTPLIYSVNPFTVENGEVSWLRSGNHERIKTHDQRAYEENQRNSQIVADSDGFIDMCKVVKIRNVHRGASPADPNIDEGPAVEFHQEVSDTTHDDGATDEFEDDRTFELLMRNGLVIRLQAYNKQAKEEWKARLKALVQYWKLRIAADMELFKIIRHTNLERLNIDEEMEATIGQFAKKWEVSRSAASPQLYHMCGISCCRSVFMSGTLYRKPRRHATFLRCSVILTAGSLLVFQGSLRRRTGEEVPHIHSERMTTIPLNDCYLYSGLLTDNDLLYQNQTFDSNHPGHHALPRVYLEDGWTSIDEDTMTCFVIWQARQKSWFRSEQEKESPGDDSKSGKHERTLKHLSKLGVPGRSIVFKTRSRAERDHWVLSIQDEIERLQLGEDIRLVKGPS